MVDDILVEWLSRIVDNIKSNDNYLDIDLINDEISNIYYLGSYLFKFDNINNDLTLIINHLNNYYNNKLDVNKFTSSNHILIEGLLVYSVCNDSDIRENSIEVILSMDTNAQVVLMNAIQSNLNDYMISDEKIDSKPCINCNENIQLINQLKHQLDLLKSNYIENENKLKAEIINEQHKLIDIEIILIDKENLINQLTNHITTLNYKINILDSNTNEYNNLLLKVQSLQDEIDVLQSKANRVDIAEEQVIQLKDKLDELKSIKQQLKLETNAHIDTYNQLVTIQNELNHLNQLVMELKDYKHKHTQLVIDNNELNLIINNKNNQINELITNNQQLSSLNQLNNKEKLQLTNELEVTNQQLVGHTIVNGIDNNINEFNPALMKELNELRTNNKILNDLIDKTTVNHLNQLTSDINNLQSVNNLLQIQLLTTKENLSNANKQIQKLELDYNNLSNDLKQYIGRYKEIELLSYEEILTLKSNYMIDRKIVIDKYDDIITSNRLEYDCNINCLNYELDQRNNQLDRTTNELNNQIELFNNTITELGSLKNENEVISNKRKIELMNHTDEINELTNEINNKLTNQSNEHNNQINQLKSNYNEILDKENEKYTQLQIDYENEKIKRRRLDKEKKLLEADIYKYKTQLTMNMNSNNNEMNDYNQFMTEYKQMQSDIDKYKNELNIVKSNQINNNENERIDSNIISISTNNNTILSKPRRMNTNITTNGLINNNTTISCNNQSFINYIELTEINERKIEQLVKEKRELIAKNLLTNQEKNELYQKNLIYEKELNLMKSKLTKVTLDKERIERKYNILE